MIHGGQTTAATAQDRKIIRAALRVVRRALKEKQKNEVLQLLSEIHTNLDQIIIPST